MRNFEPNLRNICAKTGLIRSLLECNGVDATVQVSAQALVAMGSLNGKY